MSQYYKGTMNNNSWLKSAGQWNDGTVYTGMYNWLLEQMNAGVDGFKGTIGYAWKSQTSDIRFWTAIRNPSVGCAVYGGVGIPFAGTVTAINPDGTLNFYEVSTGITYKNLVYTESENINIEGTAFANIKFANDYDFVVNQPDQTFRLPLLNGSEDLPDYSVDVIAHVLNSNSPYTAAKNGLAVISPFDGTVNYKVNGSEVSWQKDEGPNVNSQSVHVFMKKGDVLSSSVSSSVDVRFYPFKGNGSLYYYVGATLQNAQLINVARIEETLVTKTNKVQAAEASMPSSRYIDLTLGASGSTYTAPANGWFWFSKIAGTNLFGVGIENKRNGMIIGSDAGAPGSGNAVMPVLAGDDVVVRYSATGETLGFRFIYAQGNQ